MTGVQTPASKAALEPTRPRTVEADVPNADADVERSNLGLGLRVADVRKSFLSPANERLDVLRGVTFSARPGETIAITGPSSSGKSTLLHLLGGLEAADHGNISLGEFEIETASSTALAAFRAKRVGFVFQFHYLLPDLSAVENVALPLFMARTPYREAISRASKLLHDTGLGSRITDHPANLSGGEQQRVAVCRALIIQPSIVLADEPTGNLDDSFVEKIGETLISYARNHGSILVMATHNLSLARICDRVFKLSAGKLLET